MGRVQCSFPIIQTDGEKRRVIGRKGLPGEMEKDVGVVGLGDNDKPQGDD